MKTNLQNAIHNLNSGPRFQPAPGFSAAVMKQIARRARRRRIANRVAIGLVAAAILGLAGYIIARALASITLPTFSMSVTVPVAVIAAACTAMMLGYDSIINRSLSRHNDKSRKQKFGNIGNFD